MTKRNKALLKVRRYRDKLITDNVNLRSRIREDEMRFVEIRKALQINADSLRAFAIASNDPTQQELWMTTEFVDKNEAIAELTLVYKILSVEREFTSKIVIAAMQRDLLRVTALCADHQLESNAHDKMLSIWSKDHGFTSSLREECGV